MFCPKCGKKNDDDATYCLLCGANFQTDSKVEFVKRTAVPSSGVMYAGFWKRFVAALIDGFITNVAIWIIGAIIVFIGVMFVESNAGHIVLAVIGYILIVVLYWTKHSTSSFPLCNLI